MPFQTILLTFNEPLNASVSIGDIVYYVEPDSNGTVSPILSGDLNDIIQLGIIEEITNQNGTSGGPITITITTAIVPPTLDAFIMFAKDKRVETSSIIGYYAKAHFVNNSTEKIELFSVGSEIFESSK